MFLLMAQQACSGSEIAASWWSSLMKEQVMQLKQVLVHYAHRQNSAACLPAWWLSREAHWKQSGCQAVLEYKAGAAVTLHCLHRPEHPFIDSTLVAVQGVRVGSEAISKICQSLDAWAQELGITKLEDSVPAGPEGLIEAMQVQCSCLCNGMAWPLPQGHVCLRGLEGGEGA